MILPLLIAAIRSATPAPASGGGSPTPGGDAAVPTIRDVAPPVEAFPYPWWVMLLAGIAVAIIVGMLCYWLYRALERRSSQPPLLPRAVALAEIEQLRSQVGTLAPYEFSIAISHVLRRYIETQYHVPALEQTSQEFLAGIADHHRFTSGERTLLAEFLERCDAIKFGRSESEESINEQLLQRATAFVQGGTFL